VPPAFSACANGLFPGCGARVRKLRFVHLTATASHRISTCFPEWSHYTTGQPCLQAGQMEIHEKKTRKVKDFLFTH
jgi:hypothetical protein